jgi:hypothetical protein
MDNLLKAPTWAIFIYLIASYSILSFNFTSDPFTNALIKSVGFVLYGIYPLSLGVVLSEYLPKKVTVNTTFFLVNWVVWIGSMIVLLILFDGQEMSFSGWLSLPFFYFMFAFIHVFLFPLRVLKSVQKRGEVSYGESVGMAFLLFFWPIGIWMIHPEVKQIVDTQVPTSDLPENNRVSDL